MSLFTELRERLRSLVFRSRQERELEEELRDHLERDVADRVRRGVDVATARRDARLALGGIEEVKERVRDERGVGALEHLAADARHAVRSLRRDPVYAAAGILVLALGLGAATTVYTVADAVLFAPLPYPDAGRLVRVGQLYPPNTTVWQLSTVDAQAIREGQRSFDAFGVVAWGSAALVGGGSPERILTGRASADFFSALGVAPGVGRLIAPRDEAPDAPLVVVLSHALAVARFGSAPAAVGHAILLDDLSHTVVGVLPPGVRELGPGIRADAWPVLRLEPPTRRGPFWLRGVGRLRDGVTLEAAARDLAEIGERIFPLWASSFQDRSARLTPVPLRESIVGGATRSVALFAAAVTLMLLIAAVNVTTLSLARATAREPELAMRAALGAGRLRLARLPLLEGIVLGLAAGAIGLGMAALLVRGLGRIAPGLPRLHEVAVGPAAAAFALAAALAGGLVVGLPPAVAAARRTPLAPGGDRRGGPGRRAAKLRAALVVSEFALALPLLLGAGLLFLSFQRLQRVDPGFDPAGVVVASIELPPARYPEPAERQRFWRRLERLAAGVTGVAAAGLATELPPADVGDINNFVLLDRPTAPGDPEHMAPWVAATEGYFEALGVALLEGRMVAESDTAAPVVLVSRAWARRYYPGESAVGRQMIAGGCTTCPPTTVVGVVGDVKYLGLREPGEAVYFPLVQSQALRAHLVVRTADAPAATLAALREVAGGLDPALPIAGQTLASRVAGALAGPGRSTAVLASFGAFAVLLAGLGVFGLMSYAVRQRRREIGVRIALGAGPRAIVRLIVGAGMRFAALGTALGLGLTLVQARFLEASLFGVEATDGRMIALAAAVLLAVAAGACWLPAARAWRIDPVEAITTE